MSKFFLQLLLLLFVSFTLSTPVRCTKATSIVLEVLEEAEINESNLFHPDPCDPTHTYFFSLNHTDVK
jgi:hypothetical protein